MADKAPPKFFDTVGASEFLGGIAPATLKSWRCSRRGPRFVRLGRKIAYREQDLLAFVESHLSEPDGSGRAA